MLIDTHAHLWWSTYEGDLGTVLARAREAGVLKMVVPATTLATSRQAIALARQYPGTLFASVGIHPEEVGSSVDVDELRAIIADNRSSVRAVGEIGTDANTPELQQSLPAQKMLFREQCLLAIEFNLPVIIHTRQSLPETLSMLDTLPQMLRGQFHCFSYDEAGLTEVLSRGFYVSFCGNITWSRRVAKLVPLVPADRLLLETDSPLMVPRDKKGEPINQTLRNEPSNVRMLAQLQAELRGVTLDELAEQTSANATRLYGL